jgi:hypothetical protein
VTADCGGGLLRWSATMGAVAEVVCRGGGEAVAWHDNYDHTPK